MKSNPFDKYLKPEQTLQIQVCQYIEIKYPRAVIYHSPNEGKRSAFEQYLLRKMRVLSGFPDLVILDYKLILFIELKVLKSGKKQPNQIWWIDILNRFGFPAYFCFGFDEAIRVIDKHLSIKHISNESTKSNVGAGI
ncbi:VRR-NUC domain-containing protein [Runella salmonicolor]|uniref:VRR-NUC domain-containing protein n=1 Tax=Runella salmonicolor TaxID=2950278 RepID=A0ABT1FSX9_9BACT|nr:VRR-NUC domain-containing protein [Runella salmonicolor]MCP1384865.1 VRR-NUC domain-containing protein [Runella salmonicolor]